MADSTLVSEITEYKEQAHKTIESLEQQDASWRSAGDSMTISATVLIFGLLVMGAMTYLIHKGHDPQIILRTFGMSLIIVMSVFLVVAGYSDQQIAPVMGLLGTIAGYLLGRGSNES